MGVRAYSSPSHRGCGLAVLPLSLPAKLPDCVLLNQNRRKAGEYGSKPRHGGGGKGQGCGLSIEMVPATQGIKAQLPLPGMSLQPQHHGHRLFLNSEPFLGSLIPWLLITTSSRLHLPLPDPLPHLHPRLHHCCSFLSTSAPGTQFPQVKEGKERLYQREPGSNASPCLVPQVCPVWAASSHSLEC